MARGASLLLIEHSVLSVCLSMLSITDNKNLRGKGPTHALRDPVVVLATGSTRSSAPSGTPLPQPRGSAAGPQACWA